MPTWNRVTRKDYGFWRIAACGSETNATRKPAASHKLNIVNALNIKNAGNALHPGKYALQLLAILHIQRDFNARPQILPAALKRANVCAVVADYRRNARQHSRSILGQNPQAHRKSRMRLPRPLDGDAPLRVVKQVLHVRTIFPMHRNP